MRYLILVAAALSALALGACDKPAAVAPPPAPVVVVPGPPGPPGAPGAQGVEGAKGEKGGGTIVVVPAPETQR